MYRDIRDLSKNCGQKMEHLKQYNFYICIIIKEKLLQIQRNNRTMYQFSEGTQYSLEFLKEIYCITEEQK